MCMYLPIILPRQLPLTLDTLTAMKGTLKIATGNCQYVRSSEPYIRDILKQVHIMALHATWFCCNEVSRLNSLHKDYVSFSTSTIDESQILRRSRPYGGLGFYCGKRVSKYIKVCHVQHPRVLSITYKDYRFSMFLVNVHVPTSNVENRDKQPVYLGRLASMLDDAHE